MTHGSLFSGGGGFDLAAEWMKWDNKFHCEWDIFCQRILKYYWPNAETYKDIDESDFTKWRGLIDVLTGGFPCQPYSTSGRRKGKEDNRHKWPQMLRAIREISPRWIVGENVRGLTNWNGGLVFDEVQTDLETEGYEVTPFLLPACGINAPHRRERIWFVAYAGSYGNYQETGLGKDTGKAGINKSKENKREWIWNGFNGNDEKGIITNPSIVGQQKPGGAKRQVGSKAFGDWKASWTTNDGGWPTQSSLFTRDDGVPAKLDSITISDWIKQSNKVGGNAVVPQLVYQIFQAIQQMENINK